MEGDEGLNAQRSCSEATTTTSLEDMSAASQHSETPVSKTSSETTKSENMEAESKAGSRSGFLPLPSLETRTKKSAPFVTSEAESKFLPPSPRAYAPLSFSSFPLHPSQASLLATPTASMAGGSSSKDTALDNGKVEPLGESEADGERTEREREHKKRSKNWTQVETLKLIKLRTELEPRFAKSGRKTELWDGIAESMQKESHFRDAQQCRDKWEKLSARYKEVRDGLKDRENNPFFEELHTLLADKPVKKERERKETLEREEGAEAEGGGIVRDTKMLGEGERAEVPAGDKWEEEEEDEETEITAAPARKKNKTTQLFSAFTQLDVVQSLLESVILKQQKLFRDLLDAIEKRELRREQERQEREDTWRAEERAQRCVINNAMILLTERLIGEKGREGAGPASGCMSPTSPQDTQAHKKRSKNWKRAEVSQLIRLRGSLESRFASSTRRTGLWEEVAGRLRAEGIKRDAKQCREKWDKLMAAYKDVGDGKRERGDSPYFTELSAIFGIRPAETVEQRPPYAVN